ncbi:hypothetical protein OUZ56_012653 [Daphnia magna]|uniref:Uncharacterized protein n=1 Tax=Daphnia magna TaxID=35525 RepID=A0ABQ9Z3N5_9CRUS|nr:hypothetical protein OUZ56_012653 [Daphnia magna]
MNHATVAEPKERNCFFQDVRINLNVWNHIFNRRKLIEPSQKMPKKGKLILAPLVRYRAKERKWKSQNYATWMKPFNGEIVRHSHFLTLFEWDNRKDAGMGVAFRLRHEHVFPISFSKMNVRLMAQITYFNVAKAFPFYRLKNLTTMEVFKHTKATEEMCLILNNAFDVLDGRHYKERIHTGNWKQQQKCLVDLLEAINEAEAYSKASNKNARPFLSETSLNSVRLTLTSAMELIDFLKKKCNFQIFHRGKFNQDCLDHFFVILRSCGGGHDAPTNGNHVPANLPPAFHLRSS